MPNNYSFYLMDYCDNCPEFEVKVIEDEYVIDSVDSIHPSYANHTYINNRIVTCEHMTRCKNMLESLNKKKTLIEK